MTHCPPCWPAPQLDPHRGREEAGEIHLTAIPGCSNDLPLDILGGHGAEGVQLVFRCGEGEIPPVSTPSLQRMWTEFPGKAGMLMPFPCQRQMCVLQAAG